MRFGPDHLQPVRLEPHILHDVRAHRASEMRKRRTLEAGMKFFGDRSASDDGAAFEHKRFVSGLRQIESRNQAVVPAADDNDVTMR